jgi:acyl-CoA synthetase (NDP forming)
MGNKADISGNDLMGYWHHDPRTDVILLYLESFGNPRRFARLARAISRVKPIVVVKSGRSTVGARAVGSHTGALLAASDVTVDALFRQAGVIRADTLAEMLDVTDLLVQQPLPRGRRVAVVTNVGGPAVMSADLLEARGLEVAVLSEQTQERLRQVLPAAASTTNPIDMLAAASAESYERTLSIVAEDAGVDAIIALFLSPLTTNADDVARAIARVRCPGKPLLAVFMQTGDLPDTSLTDDGRVPVYRMPEPAVIALAHAVRYAEWLAQPVEPFVHFDDVRRDEARALLADRLARGTSWLDPADVRMLLDFYGVPAVEQRVVASVEEAAAAAEDFGGQVALKAIAPGVLHKTDAGAVRLHLHGEGPTRAAAKLMTDQVRSVTGHGPTGFVVQRMAPLGVEMLVGVVNDAHFGPTVACGAGGITVELLHDVAVRLAPLTRADAAQMLRELRSYPLLDGYRGARKCALDTLEDLLLRVSALAEDHPQISEIDCNPTMVSPTGALVVDARIRIAPPVPSRPLGARRS